MNIRSARKTFRSPPRASRPGTLWYWNDDLDSSHAVAQLDSLMDAGLGLVYLQTGEPRGREGAFSDVTLETLSAIARHARKRGAEIGIRDEAAGLPVAPEDDLAGVEHGAGALILEQLRIPRDAERPILPDDTLAAFLISDGVIGPAYERRPDGGITLLERAVSTTPVLFEPCRLGFPDAEMLVFRVRKRLGRVSFLHKSDIEAFLHRVREPVAQQVKRYLGSTIVYWLLNNAGLNPAAGELPWDPELPNLFRETRGYRLIEHLPALFFDVPGHETIRYDYWTLVEEMFREGYVIPTANWCSTRKIAAVGAFRDDAPLKAATRNVGNVMPLYGYSEAAVVHVRVRPREEQRLRDLVALKQAVSVGRQLGHEGVTAVLCTGRRERFSFQEHLVAAHTALALGASRVSHDSTLYSLRGYRKEGVQPFDWRQPFWPFANKYFDTLAAMSWLLTEGRPHCRTLVLHPAASMQAAYRHALSASERKSETYLFDADRPFEAIDKHFALVCDALWKSQIEFDLADAQLTAMHGRADRKRFVVGKQTYRVIVIPPSTNIRSAMLSLLHDFAVGGGQVVLVGSAPHLVDGRPSDEAKVFSEHYAVRIIDGVDRFDYSELTRVLVAMNARTVEVTSPEGDPVPDVKVQRRQWEDREIIMLANQGRRPLEIGVRLHVDCEGQLEEWDPSSGQTMPIADCAPDEPVELNLSFPAALAKALVAIPGKRRPLTAPEIWEDARRVPLEWSGRHTVPNVVSPGACHIVDDDERSSLMSLHEVRDELRSRLLEANGPVILTTVWPFEVSPILPLDNPCQVVIEPPQECGIALNGEPLDMTDAPWELDVCFKVISGTLPVPGKNILEITGSYSSAEEFRAPWIQGDFGVGGDIDGATELELVSGPIPVGDWTRLGFPQFAGTMVYQAVAENLRVDEDERVFLMTPSLEGWAQVRVNGQVVDHFLWPPFECDVTGHWNNEATAVEIEVANTLENILVADGAFEPNERREPRAFGLLSPPELVIRKRVRAKGDADIQDSPD